MKNVFIVLQSDVEEVLDWQSNFELSFKTFGEDVDSVPCSMSPTWRLGALVSSSWSSLGKEAEDMDQLCNLVTGPTSRTTFLFEGRREYRFSGILVV